MLFSQVISKRLFFCFVPFFASAITSGSIRLQDGKPSTGRVEIFYNNQRGTVCGDAWDVNDAKVVCRQLGALHASQAFSSAYHGQAQDEMADLMSLKGFLKIE